MQLKSLLLLAASATSTLAASSWGFSDATVSVQGKGAGIGSTDKLKITQGKSLSSSMTLGAADTLKLLLTTQEDKAAKRPHQAFLLLKDTDTGLDLSYPLSLKDSGKGKVELTHKDLPVQFLKSSKKLAAEIVLASFGSAKPYQSKAFDLTVELDASLPAQQSEKPLRYGKLPEIHHIFKDDATSPPVVISLFFLVAVLGALPVLGGTWLYLGGNLNHLTKAFQSAPLSHGLFVGSIVGLEGAFFLYYTSWNLFQLLPAAAALGLVAFLSGSRALSEVQERRLAGLR